MTIRICGPTTQLVVGAGGGLLVLLVLVGLSAYKLRGKTQYGLYKQSQKDMPRQGCAVFRP